MNDLTQEELEQILGSDYETLIAEALRNKNEAMTRDTGIGRQAGVLPSGHTYFDPGAAIEKYANRYRATKDQQKAQADLDNVLGQQKQSRKAYANVLTRAPAPPPAPTGPPRTADSTIPAPTAAPTPPPAAPRMAPGAPPALANAATMPPDRLAAAGVPPDVQALLDKLRNR